MKILMSLLYKKHLYQNLKRYDGQVFVNTILDCE